jgi:hypothetical protein
MPTALIIRSYPAPGAQPTPKTYRAGAYGYVVVCLVPVAFASAIGAALLDPGQKPRWLILPLVILLVTILLAVLFLRALQLDIATDGVTYKNPARGTRSVKFSEMSSVVLIDYRHEEYGSPRTNRSWRRWTLVITPKPETGNGALKIPLTLFDRNTHDDLVSLLKPEVWDSFDP